MTPRAAGRQVVAKMGVYVELYMYGQFFIDINTRRWNWAACHPAMVEIYTRTLAIKGELAVRVALLRKSLTRSQE